MARMRCIAIDDEPLALRLLEQYAAQTPALEMIRVFEDAISGCGFLRSAAVDLLFVDINMPDISGLDLVRSLEHKPLVIFTTAYKKFAYDGFELDAVDYLLKPIDYERFSKGVQKALVLHQKEPEQEQDYLFVRSEYRMVKISINDIEHIEGLEDYIKIHLVSGKPLLTLMTLKSMLEKLPPGKFIRIHRSHIVSAAKVMSILNKKITLTSGRQLPVSDSYLEAVNQWVKGGL